MKTLLLLGLIFLSHGANATVGGATYLHTFTYNPANESVYFIENDQSGRGCPPILNKISLNTGKIDTVFSCDDGAALPEYDQAMVEIKKITAGFKPLTQISLPANNIKADIDFIKNTTVDYAQKLEFSANVFQNDVKVLDKTIYGCEKNQPFTFGGYAIPGFNAKIILLLSATGDCFEGGYIEEQLFVVGGLTNLNKSYTPTISKSNSALVASPATLTVLESDEIDSSTASSTAVVPETVSTTSIPKAAEPISTLTILMITALALILGIAAGRTMIKR